MADEEVGNLKAKVELDTVTFNHGIKELSQKMQILGQEFKNSSAGLDKVGDAAEISRLKITKLTGQIGEQRQLVDQLKTAHANAAEQFGEGSRQAQAYELRLRRAEGALQGMERELTSTTRELAAAERNIRLQNSAWTTLGNTATSAGNRMKSAGDSIGKVGASITKVFTTALPLIGAGFLKLGEDFEKSFNTIRIGTGATGDALKGLGDDFKATLSQTGSSMENTSQVIADLNTRTGLSGKSLQDLSLQMLKLAKISKEDLNTLIPATTRMFQDAGISTDKYAEALDYTFKVSQSTGIGVGRLQELMTQFGGPLRQMGFDWQTSAAMLGKFEKEGVNTELVVGSLRIALGKMAKDGIKEPAKELQGMIEKIKAAGTAGEANALSLEMFGAKAGPDMAAAIREGRMDLNGLLTALKDSPETINKAAADTATFSGKLAKLKNQMAVAFEPIGTKFVDSFDKLTPAITQISNAIADMAKKIADLSPEQQGMILKFALTAVVIGPVLSVISKLLLVGSGLATALGTISGAIAVVTTGAAAATPAIGALVGVFTFMTGPIGIAIASVAALAAIAFVVVKNWEPIKGFFSNLWAGITATTTAAWEGIKQFFGQIPGIVSTFLGAAVVKISEFGSKIISWVTTEIPLFVNNFMTLLGELPGKIGYALGFALGTIVKFGIDAVNWVMTEVPKFIGRIINFYAELPGKIGTLLSGVLTKISEWGGNAINWVAIEVPKFISRIINFYAELPGKIATQLSNVLTSLITWASNMMSTAETEVPKIVSSIVSFFSGLPGKMFDVGGDIVRGLWNGIANLTSWLGNKVRDFAGGVIQGMKDALDIKSPSRVMRDEVGLMMGAGVAEGIEKSRGMVSTAMNGLSRVAINTTSNINKTSTTTNDNRNAGGITIINKGTIVGSNGMNEFADIVSRKIARTTGLAMGGAW